MEIKIYRTLDIIRVASTFLEYVETNLRNYGTATIAGIRLQSGDHILPHVSHDTGFDINVLSGEDNTVFSVVYLGPA